MVEVVLEVVLDVVEEVEEVVDVVVEVEVLVVIVPELDRVAVTTAFEFIDNVIFCCVREESVEDIEFIDHAT
jgi:hypothetical protein